LYNRNLKKDFRFTAGVTAALSSSVNAVNNTYYYNYLLSNLANGVEVVKDSIFNETKTKGSIVLPDYIKAGITISKSSKWTAGLDFSFQNWKKYRNFESTDTLDNSYRIATGGEYRTDKLIYRFGAHYGKSFINLRSTQLNDAGISVGLGILRLFPKRPPSSINIAIEVGQRGTTDNNLIREKYIRLHLGFTLSDIWFVKPKYD
jgi:long-subunit fatty acid transport protein